MGFLDELGQRISQGANAPNLAFLILLAVLIVAPLLAGFARLPAMVGLVLAGMLIGPHGFGILASKQIALTALGNFGLLYLMFNAGLELDLKKLARNKRVAIAFALLSFAIPFVLGVTSAYLLGYAVAAAILMGSNWGSHTLVTYPMLRKMGLSQNHAVSTVVGATAVTDTLALLVLAGVSVSAQRSGSFLTEGLEVFIGLGVLVVWSLFGLPRLGRWFFARVGSDTAQRFVFALGAFFFGAILAEGAGIDGIVGAFFAGLGLGRAIPSESPLMERVQFVGGALFVPIFLVSVGILLDPSVMVEPKTLLYALVFTVVVLGGKTLAAIVVGRWAHFNKHEIGVMSGLSGSQAAATLATTLVGARLGLFDPLTINAVLVVILATLVITPAEVTIFGRKLKSLAKASAREAEPIGHTVLVPVFDESTRPMLGLAGRLAEEDTGLVVAGSFVSEHASEAELARNRLLRAEAEEWLADEGLEARSLFRISRSPVAGLVQTVRGEHATMVVADYDQLGRLEADSEVTDVLHHAPVPVVLAHGPVESFDRAIVVIARAEELVPPGRQDLELARELVARLAHGRPVTVVSAPLGDQITGLFATTPHVESISSVDPIGWVQSNARESDLFVLPGLDEAQLALARSPDLVGHRFMVAIAARPLA